MEIQQLIDDLKTLALQEDVLAVSREINEIKSKFDDQLLEIERRDQVASMEAEVNGEVNATMTTILIIINIKFFLSYSRLIFHIIITP